MEIWLEQHAGVWLARFAIEVEDIRLSSIGGTKEQAIQRLKARLSSIQEAVTVALNAEPEIRPHEND